MADKKFADYVKDLMGVLPTVNGNPMLSVTSMTDENARYREDPFYISRQRQADQLALDEEEKRRLAAQSGSGMMRGSTSVDSGRDAELTQAQIDFLDRESGNLAERGERIKNDWFGLKPIGAYMGGGMLGLDQYLGSQAPTLNDLLYKQDIYNKTPAWLQKMLPESYQLAGERAKEYESIMGGVTPYEDITPTFSSDWSSTSDWSPSERTQEQMDYTRDIGDFSV